MTEARPAVGPRSKLLEARRIFGLLRRLPRDQSRAATARLLEWPASRQARLARAFEGAPGRLVFVCHGNIMRSAFAVAYLQSQWPEHAGRVAGAGTHAGDGNAAEPTAARIASEMGVSLSTHRSVPYVERGITARDVVICMDRANEASVLVASPNEARSVFLIGDVGGAHEREVLDPYGRGDQATRDAFTAIASLSMQWLSLLRRALG